jgi:hypothetical protein
VQQLDDQSQVAGPLGVAQGVDRLLARQPPSSRGSLQFPVGLRAVPSEIGDQIGAEQRVDPVIGGGEALDQRRRRAELVELPVGVGPARQRRPAQPATGSTR